MQNNEDLSAKLQIISNDSLDAGTPPLGPQSILVHNIKMLVGVGGAMLFVLMVLKMSNYWFIGMIERGTLGDTININGQTLLFSGNLLYETFETAALTHRLHSQ